MYINLYSGIPKVAYLGESSETVLSRQWRRKPLNLPKWSGSAPGNFKKAYEFPDVGVRVYFRSNLVSLIEVQEPFPGYIAGRKSPLFYSSPPNDSKWKEHFVRTLGKPKRTQQNGPLGTEALFYRWGDVVYNRVGPSQIALYRLPGVQKYRWENFAKSLKLFR